MNLKLFNEEPLTAVVGNNLIRIKSAGTTLTPEQFTFNKLVKRIESLQRQIREDTLKLDELNKVYQDKIGSSLIAWGQLKIQLCHLLDSKRKAARLSKTQHLKLDDIIYDLLEDGLGMTEMDPETEKLYKKYEKEGYTEEKQQMDEEEKEVFCEMFFENFGLHIDPSMLTDNPDFEKIQEDLEKQMGRSRSGSQQSKKKTKKQKEKELFEQQKQELKNKSLRSIYVGLAKLLHPDAEPDESLKLEKEEMMKQVTIAYNNKDLMCLLKLEMQWINNYTNTLIDMDTDLLAVYIQLLKDQVKDLENEKAMLIFQPVYALICPFLTRSTQAAPHEINSEAKRIRRLVHHLKGVVNDLEKGVGDAAVIKNYIRDYYEGTDVEWYT